MGSAARWSGIGAVPNGRIVLFAAMEKSVAAFLKVVIKLLTTLK